MSGVKGTKQTTEKDFTVIHTLADAGLPSSKIHEVTGRSLSTISVMLQSEDYKEYQQRIRDMAKPKGERSETTKAPAALIAIDDQLLNNINAVLHSLDERLKWVEENIEVPTKRKLW